jgi:Na+-driven multidrug efflux pump
MDVVTGTSRGMGISVPPLVISVMCICAFRMIWIFTVFRIPEFHTPASLYITYPISWTMTFVGEYIVYRIALKKYMNKTEMAN